MSGMSWTGSLLRLIPKKSQKLYCKDIEHGQDKGKKEDFQNTPDKSKWQVLL